MKACIVSALVMATCLMNDFGVAGTPFLELSASCSGEASVCGSKDGNSKDASCTTCTYDNHNNGPGCTCTGNSGSSDHGFDGNQHASGCSGVPGGNYYGSSCTQGQGESYTGADYHTKCGTECDSAKDDTYGQANGQASAGIGFGMCFEKNKC